MAYREVNATAAVLQLQALQSQMNPHFIGNSINAIQQFVHPPDPEKISEYISLFMRLLRRTLLFSEKTFISFQEEAAYDREYLQLVQLRFGERIQTEITGMGDIPPETPVPSMLLQPILENATIHGLNPNGLSLIRLNFSIENEQFKCVLTDNGLGFGQTRAQKQMTDVTRESKGLEMLRQKINTLNRLYGLDINILVKDLAETIPPQKGTQVIITYHVGKIWKTIKK
jgi:sensor histidine kinase YesM